MPILSGKILCIKWNTKVKRRATKCTTPDSLRDDVLFTTIKVVSRHQTTQQYGVILPIELTNDDIRNNKAYKEYYACATGEAAPKPKASARKKTSGYLLLLKGREESEGDKTDESDDDNDDDDDEEETIKIGEQEVAESDEGDDEATESDRESEDEETREQKEEKFDPISQTPEDDEDDGNNEEDQGLRIGEEERMQEEEDVEELYRDVDINQGRGLQVSQETEDTHVILTSTQLGVDILTPELLAGPTYELMRGSCNSMTELEYHLEEVYKATTDQLDWVNPEGQQYPHNLLQPLPLIPDNRGRSVIPFEHFINNDLEYLRGGASSRKYTTFEPMSYNKHALWGVSLWGRKRQQFYGFTVNRESALDVYSKRRIIAVTELKIVEWHNYKHLDWISVRRDDDKRRDAQCVHNALDDRLKGIWMQYLPTTIWRGGDKTRAAAMIQAID
nr:hypothetical protein [Tanacetum cinerariifolium]